MSLLATVEIAGVTFGPVGTAMLAIFGLLLLMAFVFGDSVTKGGRAIRHERHLRRMQKRIRSERH